MSDRPDESVGLAYAPDGYRLVVNVYGHPGTAHLVPDGVEAQLITKRGLPHISLEAVCGWDAAMFGLVVAAFPQEMTCKKCLRRAGLMKTRGQAFRDFVAEINAAIGGAP